MRGYTRSEQSVRVTCVNDLNQNFTGWAAVSSNNCLNEILLNLLLLLLFLASFFLVSMSSTVNGCVIYCLPNHVSKLVQVGS